MVLWGVTSRLGGYCGGWSDGLAWLVPALFLLAAVLEIIDEWLVALMQVGDSIGF